LIGGPLVVDNLPDPQHPLPDAGDRTPNDSERSFCIVEVGPVSARTGPSLWHPCYILAQTAFRKIAALKRLRAEPIWPPQNHTCEQMLHICPMTWPF
jgi:hypothetical protein